MRRLARILLASLSTGALAIGLTGAVSAQPAASPADEAANTDIVVTARGRDERLQDVPLSVSAFTADDLQRGGVDNLRDLATLTPGLTVNDGGGEFYSAPTIRGLSQLNTNNGLVENNVSVFLNGVYLPNPGAINIGLLNLDRVEVVKGPVSARYGRNAFAGAINYVTRAPSNVLTARVTGTIGTAERYSFSGLVSGPLAPGISATIGSLYDSYGGTWRDPVNGNGAGGYEKRNVTAALRAELSPDVVLAVSGYYGNDTFAPSAENHLANNCAPNGATLTQYCGEIAEGQSVVVPATYQTGATANRRDVKHLDASLKAGLGEGFTLDVILGWNDAKSMQLLEINNRREGLTYPLTPGPGSIAVNEFYGDDLRSKDFSGEVRLTSPQDRPLTFSAGAFYYQLRGRQITNITIPNDNIPAGQSLNGVLVNLFLSPGGRPFANRNDATVLTDQYSGFGEAEYKISDTVALSQELRYTDETKGIQVLSLAVAPTLGPQPPISAKFRYWNSRTTLTYQANSDLTLYASAANGTKTGGFNARATLPADLRYGPEKNWTYEFGAKGALAGGRIRYEAAVYHIQLRDQQILGPSSNISNPGQVIGNYGAGTNTGFEISTQLRLNANLSANLGFAYNDAKFKTGATDIQYAGICARIPSCAGRLTTRNGQSVIDLSGLALPRQSKYQVTAALDANIPLSDDIDAFANLRYAYQSKQFFQPANFSYWGPTHDLGIRAGIKSGKFTATAWVENLLQETDAYNAYYNIKLTDFVFETLPIYRERRTFGLTLAAEY